MTSSSITLVIESDNTAPRYQWQWAKSENGAFTDIEGAKNSTYTLSNLNQDTDSGKWYRCEVDGTASKAVMIVYPGKDSRTWTNYNIGYNISWYISNGTVAYMANDKVFDVYGLYKTGNTDYMLCTSLTNKWYLFSRSSSPESGIAFNYDLYHVELDALRVSFDENDLHSVLFEADLKDTEQAFCLGSPVQIGYSSSASFGAVKEGDHLQQMVVCADPIDTAVPGDPALVIRPDEPACQNALIDEYNSMKNYADNTGTGSSVSMHNRVENYGITMSWLNVPAGGKIRFKFSVGAVADVANRASYGIDYYDEKLTGLNNKSQYWVYFGKDQLSLMSDEDGKIALKGTGEIYFPGNIVHLIDYSCFGETLAFSRGQGLLPDVMQVPPRPTAETPKDEDIIRDTGSVTFTAANGQDYEYDADGNGWQDLPVGADGKCVITGLQPGADVKIRTRKPATDDSFASDWNETSVRIAKTPIHPTVTMEDWVVGGEPSKPVVTGNPGNGAVTIEYKLREDDLTSYRPEAPTQPGEYTVRALIAETATYQKGWATADFSILPRTDSLPQTGDGSRPALWLGLLALAGAGLAALLLRRRKD